jgi:RING finger and CHY zinc finger domain-containing protein 1
MSSAEIRTKISAIAANPNLSAIQKSVQCQQVLTANNAFCSGSASNRHRTCKHYKTKGCSQFFFECCGVYDPCHRCHHARGCTVKPPRISTIECNHCMTTQSPSPMCINCQTPFSRSYCGECLIWTDLEIFHCDKCSVCRVGKASDMFHCDNCEACFSIVGREAHRCAKTKLKDAHCPICLESVHTAQSASTILPCGHVVHCDCWHSAASKGEFRCPSCRKSLIDMKRIWASIRRNIANNPLPRGFLPIHDGDVTSSPFGDFVVVRKRDKAEYEKPNSNLCEGYFPHWQLANGKHAQAILSETILDKKKDVDVWCFDCEQKSTTLFHIAGLECKCCGSFNTTRR